MTKTTFYITTPIYYVNAAPHIGTAYSTLFADVIARFKRLEGEDVYFLTGTDEHGQKIEKSAEKLGMNTQAFVDDVSQKFKYLFSKLNISNNYFIRTTDQHHKKAALHLWEELKKNKHIYLDKYSGWYSIRDESFYSKDELIDGKAPTGAEVEWISEESYFFDLSKWQDKLLEFYEKNPDFVQPKWRFNEIINFVKSGLRDLSISRTSFSWGIPISDNSKHVMYVWLDALTNYLSGISYPDENADNFAKCWPADMHIVGKDITKFHAIYWPAFLMAAGLEVPKTIVSHGWWLNEGEKISKSLGNAIDPIELIEKYGLDQVRYYLMRDMSFGNDGNFVQDTFITRINAELSNKLGNLVQRTLSMIHNYCDKTMPKFNASEISDMYENNELLKKSLNLFSRVKTSFDAHEFNKSLEVIFEVIDDINNYVESNAPWKLRKSDMRKTEEILYIAIEAVRYPVIMLIPFIPDAANLILDQMKIPDTQRNFESLSLDCAIHTHEEIAKPIGVFPRIDAE